MDMKSVMDSLSIDQLDALDRVAKLLKDLNVDTMTIMPSNGLCSLTGICGKGTVTASAFSFAEAVQAYSQRYTEKLDAIGDRQLKTGPANAA